MNLTDASKKDIDVVLENCGWRQTKQRLVLLKSIFDGNDKHFPSIRLMKFLRITGVIFLLPLSMKILTL